MINDNTIDRKITNLLISEQEEEAKEHISSGKLTASMLGQPLLFQILKKLNVKEKDFEPYVLRKFKRGNHVEEWIKKYMDGIISEQEEVTYRDAFGKIDVLIDSSSYEFNLGIIPHEIKSVANMKFKNILRNGEADPQHKLQACFYALAKNSKYYAIDYVASDDYRIKTMIYETEDLKEEVDKIIDEYNYHIENKIIPDFVARYKWQESKEYSMFPDFIGLKSDEVKIILEKLQINF